jgi:alcohol dehydrogenase class IV
MTYPADLNFAFAHTRRLNFGGGALNEIGSLVGDLGFQRALIVTDSFLAQKTDFVERARKSLGTRCAGVFSGVVPDPTAESIDRGAEEARRIGCDVLISIGGGSAIDTAKGMAVVLREGGRVLDHEGYHALTREPWPHIAIPTTAGTGSEMTMVTVIKDTARGQKTFIGSYYLHPLAAVLDPELTVKMPPKLTAATGMDALSHALESLLSNLRNPFSDACAFHAIELIVANLPRCLGQPDDLAARGQMLVAAALAGSAFSNAMVNLNHALAHALGARFGVHHGTANAIFLPHTMRFFSDLATDRLALAARAMGIRERDQEQAARKATDFLERFIRGAGLVERLSDYGVKEADLPGLAELALGDGSIIYSPKPVSDVEEIVGLLRQAL